MTEILLDTVVISALRRPDRAPAVAAWSAAQPTPSLWLSVLSLIEITRGIEAERGRDPGFADALTRWRDESVIPAFEGRLIAVDPAIAMAAGALSAASGRNDLSDITIAATALTFGLALATRNVRHFEGLTLDGRRLSVIDPWAG